MLRHISTTIIYVVLLLTGVQSSWSDATDPRHRVIQGTVVDKAGSPAVKIPNGTVYQLNANQAIREGHALPKMGEEVTIVIDENNDVIEMHPKGTLVNHRFITGEVVSVGLRQGIITLKTSNGEQTFPLEKRQMSASVRDGATVKVELNEAGSVIDLQPLEHLQLNPNDTRTPINRSH